MKTQETKTFDKIYKLTNPKNLKKLSKKLNPIDAIDYTIEVNQTIFETILSTHLNRFLSFKDYCNSIDCRKAEIELKYLILKLEDYKKLQQETLLLRLCLTPDIEEKEEVGSL